jgi:regulator of sigma E protease
LGGVLFNFLLALFIYAMILFAWGESYIPLQKAKWGMEFNQTAKDAGFRDGDILLSADEKPLHLLNTKTLLTIVDARQVTVLRDGKEATVYIPEDMMTRLMGDSVRFADYRFPFVVDSLLPGSAAALAGMQPGDSITQLNGKDIDYYAFNAAKSRLLANKEASHEMKLTIVRAGVTDTVSVLTDSLFNICVYPHPLPIEHKSYGFFASLPAGISLGVETLQGYVWQMKYVFTRDGAKQVGGFGTIASIFPAAWDWHQFWYMTAFLSIILAFMNILPIPILDGGYVLFILYEMITRRKPGEKFMERAQMVGMIFIVALLIWANFNDILRFLF